MTSCRVWSFNLIIPWKQQYLIPWSVVLLKQPCAIVSLLSSYVATHKRHPTKTTTNQIVCKLLFTFYNREFVFTSGRCLLLFFQIWFPPSLNLSCHLLSPPIRPPIHPIVNSCPSLKRTSTLTFTFSIQFSTVNWPCYECGPIEHNFP